MKIISKFSLSRLFGGAALVVAIAQAGVFACAANGVHISPKAGAFVGVLTTALAWLSRSPFAHKLGLDQPDTSVNTGSK
jgi:hypothetical protein